MQRLIYVILETERDPEGYIPCIVKEGETGYYRTDWNWGTDLAHAREIAKRMNERMGIDAQTAEQIHDENMRLSFAQLREANHAH